MIITTLAVFQGNAEAALDLLRWITELGGVQHRTLVLATTPNTDAVPLIVEARKSWGRVEQFTIQLPQESLPWPVGNNLMFYAVCQFMQRFNQPFFWLEPDVVPTRASWLDELEVEYAGSGKLFLGVLSTLRYYGREVPDSLHMNGAGVYPANVLKYLPTATYLTTALVREPWDVRLRWEMLYLIDGNGGFKPGPTNGRVSICHPSLLICLCYKSYNFHFDPDGDIHCVCQPAVNYRALDLQRHALHHGCKDGSLLTLLRERIRSERGVPPTEPPRRPELAPVAPQNPPPQTPTPRAAPRVVAKRRSGRKTKKTRRRKRPVPPVPAAEPATVS